MMNSLLLLESFWKEKVERLFPVHHTIIVNYRQYYLIEANRNFGRLYDLRKRVSFGPICNELCYFPSTAPKHFLVVGRMGLYRSREFPDHWELIVPGVIQVTVAMGLLPISSSLDRKLQLMLLRKEMTPLVLVVTWSDRSSLFEIEIMPIPDQYQILLAIEKLNINDLVGYHRLPNNNEYLLLRNGILIHKINEKWKRVSLSPVFKMMGVADNLWLLLVDGSLLRYYVEQKVLHIEPIEGYSLNFSFIDTTSIFVRRIDGIDRYSRDKDNNYVVQERINFPREIRNIIVYDKQYIITTTEGDGYLYEKEPITERYPKLCYQGIGRTDVLYFIALSCNELTTI